MKMGLQSMSAEFSIHRPPVFTSFHIYLFIYLVPKGFGFMEQNQLSNSPKDQ